MDPEQAHSQLKLKSLLGSVVLGLGTLSGAFFLWGLSWMP